MNILSAILALHTAAAAILNCRELATPRIFGGNFKQSEFLSVAILKNGDIVAGGYTLDETIFDDMLRDEDGIQDSTPVLAFYPQGDVNLQRLYQIFIWPNEMPIGLDGQVTAVATARDYDGSSGQETIALLVDLRKDSPKHPQFHSSYAVLLAEADWSTLAEYEVYHGVRRFSTNNKSIYYRHADDSLFICFRYEAGNRVEISLLVIHSALQGPHFDYGGDIEHKVPSAGASFYYENLGYTGFEGTQWMIGTNFHAGNSDTFGVGLTGAISDSNGNFSPVAYFTMDKGLSPMAIAANAGVLRSSSEKIWPETAVYRSCENFKNINVFCIIDGMNDSNLRIDQFFMQKTLVSTSISERQSISSSMPAGVLFTTWQMGLDIEAERLFFFAWTTDNKVGFFGDMELTGWLTTCFYKIYRFEQFSFVNQATFGATKDQLALVGRVNADFEWQDATGSTRQIPQSSLVPKRAFVVATHSMCPVLKEVESMAANCLIWQYQIKEQSELFLVNFETKAISQFNALQIRLVKQDFSFGAIRLINMMQLDASQTDMDVATFDNKIDEDPEYVAPPIHEQCLDPVNFPYCQNGQYKNIPSAGGGEHPVAWFPDCPTDWTLHNLCDEELKWIGLSVWNPPPSQDEVKTAKLKYGMNTRFVEPWLQCKAKQRFNDNIRGFIHGADTDYLMHRSSYRVEIQVGRLELFPIFTDSCYWQIHQFEMTRQSEGLAVLNMPSSVVKLSYGQDDKYWLTNGDGFIGIQTTDPNLLGQTEMIWLGSMLSNGQFYQATIIVEYKSYCNDLTFYDLETFQVVYVSVFDLFPFVYEPSQIAAVTREIASVCRSDDAVLNKLGTKNEAGSEDYRTKELIKSGLVSLNNNKIQLKQAYESLRMQSFQVYQMARYSDYMNLDVWSTIEVRFVCSVDDYEIPIGAQPVNIFDIIAFTALVYQQQREEDLPVYQISSAIPIPVQDCGYPTTIKLILIDKALKMGKVPSFVELEQNFDNLSIRLEPTINLQSTLLLQEVFRRFNFAIEYSTPNEDLLTFVGISEEEFTDSNGKTLQTSPKIVLPFIFQLQELGKENKPPEFNQAKVRLPAQVQVARGQTEIIKLPPIVDAEMDEVIVMVQIESQNIDQKNNCTGMAVCYISFSSDEMLITIAIPSDYQSDLKPIRPTPTTKPVPETMIVPAFDDAGNLIEVETSRSEMIDTDPILSEGDVELQEIKILLDDGTQITEYFIALIIGDQDSNPTDMGKFDQIDNPQEEDKDNNQGATNDSSSPEEESYVKEQDDDFDFLEWLAERKNTTRKMHQHQPTKYFNPEIVPWPSVQKVSPDGEILIKFAQPVSFLQCHDQQCSQKRQLQDASNFSDSEEYKKMLKKRKNVVVRLIPSSNGDKQQLQFDWQIEELSREGVKIRLQFSKPEYVSCYGQEDMLQIQFQQTHTFMVDQNGETRNILPSGHFILAKLPKQNIKSEYFTDIDKAQVQKTSKTIVAAVPIVSFFFNVSMQQLWGSISSLQIIAHLPLLRIAMPPNVRLLQETLIDVVTFDLFGYWIEDINFGQTETEAYSKELEYLDYDSLNILTNLFSVHIFVAVLLSQAILAFVLNLTCLRNCVACKCLIRSNFQLLLVQGMLRILYSGFQEILICSIVGLWLFDAVGDQMTSVDEIAAVVTITYLIALIIFVFVLCWFVFWRMRTIVKIKETRDMLELLQILRIIRQKTEQTSSESSLAGVKLKRLITIKGFNELERQRTIDLSQCARRTDSIRGHIATKLEKCLGQSSNQRENSQIETDIEALGHTLSLLNAHFQSEKYSYRKYLIFFEGNKISQWGRYDSFFFILRRTLFVLTALFLMSEGLSLITFAVYIFTSFANLVFSVTAQPLLDKQSNRIEAGNETIVLLTSYCAVGLLDSARSRQELLTIGNLMKAIIYVSIFANLLIVSISFCVQLQRKAKLYYRNRSQRKQNKKQKEKRKKSQHADMGNEQFKLKLVMCQQIDILDVSEIEDTARGVNETFQAIPAIKKTNTDRRFTQIQEVATTLSKQQRFREACREQPDSDGSQSNEEYSSSSSSSEAFDEIEQKLEPQEIIQVINVQHFINDSYNSRYQASEIQDHQVHLEDISEENKLSEHEEEYSIPLDDGMDSPSANQIVQDLKDIESRAGKTRQSSCGDLLELQQRLLIYPKSMQIEPKSVQKCFGQPQMRIIEEVPEYESDNSADTVVIVNGERHHTSPK